jgi:alpha-N-arabinofuranosidase
MDMVPVLSVWDGKSYGGIVSGEELQPYLDDIKDELEVTPFPFLFFLTPSDPI